MKIIVYTFYKMFKRIPKRGIAFKYLKYLQISPNCPEKTWLIYDPYNSVNVSLSILKNIGDYTFNFCQQDDLMVLLFLKFVFLWL